MRELLFFILLLSVVYAAPFILCVCNNQKHGRKTGAATVILCILLTGWPALLITCLSNNTEEKKQAELEEERKQTEAEAARKQAEAEAARKQAEAEAARKQAEFEAARKKAEIEAARKKAEIEATRKKAEIEAAAKETRTPESQPLVLSISEFTQEKVRRMYMECEPAITDTPQAQKELFTALCAIVPTFEVMLVTAGYTPSIFNGITGSEELESTVLRIAAFVEKTAGIIYPDKLCEIIKTDDRDALLKGMKCLDIYSGILSSPVIKEEYKPRHIHDVLTAAIESLGKIIEVDSLPPAPKERKDIIGKKFCMQPIEYLVLFEICGKPISDSIWNKVSINIMTGRPVLIRSEMVSHGFVTGSNNTSENISFRELREFIKKCPDKYKKKHSPENLIKLEKISEDNWRTCIPEEMFQKLAEQELAYETATKEVPAPPETDRKPDFDAYYIKINRRYGSDIVFLRKTDTGWRVFKTSSTYGTGLSLYACTEDVINDKLNSDPSSHNRAFDRKLDQFALNYIMSFLPKEHPYRRPFGKLRCLTPISIYNDDVTFAFYQKGEKWVPCADYPNILEIYDALSNAAEYRLKAPLKKRITKKDKKQAEAEAKSKKLKEYNTFINTAGKLPQEFYTVKNTIREAMHKQAENYDGNNGDICMSLFLKMKTSCDFHSALEKIVRWKKNHLEYDTGYSWEVGGKLCNGNLPASATNEWKYGQQTMILTEDKPDITETEISELKKVNITLCRLIDGTSYYDWLEDVVYMYDYSEEPGMVDDAATYAYWSKEVVAEGEAAFNMLQKEIEKEKNQKTKKQNSEKVSF